MSGSQPSRRKFQRIPFSAAVTIHGKEQQWQGRLIDVSLNGILLARPTDWPLSEQETDEHYRIEMALVGTDLVITLSETTIAHQNKDKIGFKCHRIDLDSIILLKRIMELNLGDAELVYRELAALGNP